MRGLGLVRGRGFRWVCASFAVAALVGVDAARAHAHFKLLMPESWVKEDSQGNPQKMSPCGIGESDPAVTGKPPIEVDAGSMLMVQGMETVYHPGYFRISLAENRADLKDPPLTDPVGCYYDEAAVQTGAAHDNVLMDGIMKTTAATGSNRKIMQMVKMPDKTCDKCTLQVMQVMRGHGGSSCFYFHCANLKIVAPGTAKPAGMAGSGSAGAAAGSSGAGAGGMNDAASGGRAATATGGKTGAAGSGTGSGFAPNAGSGSSGTGTSSGAGTGSGAAGSVAASGGTSAMTPATKSSGGCSVALFGCNDPRLIAGVYLAGLVLVVAFSRRKRHAS